MKTLILTKVTKIHQFHKTKKKLTNFSSALKPLLKLGKSLTPYSSFYFL